MTVIRQLTSTLKSLGYPVSRITHKQDKEDPASTYFTFQLLGAKPGEYADDDFEGLIYTFDVTLTTKEECTELLDKTINALREAGFTVSSIDTELLDEYTMFYYVPMTIKMMEE